MNTPLNVLRSLIREEIGRSYQTIGTGMQTWKDMPGINVDVIPNLSRNGFDVYINDEDSEEKNFMRFFNTREDAEFYARNEVEQIFNKKMNGNSENVK